MDGIIFNGAEKMMLEQKIKDILFEIGKDIHIHKIDQNNMIIEIDYDKYVLQIMQAIKELS